VVGNKNFTDVAKPSEIVQLLLNDDQLVGLDTSATTGLSTQRVAEGPASIGDDEREPVRDLWNDEGDDFFGHVVANGSSSGATDIVEDENTLGSGTAQGKKRKTTTSGATRGRKSAPKHASGKNTGSATRNDTPDET
jgi:chromatin-remodeling ATPase INO80